MMRTLLSLRRLAVSSAGLCLLLLAITLLLAPSPVAAQEPQATAQAALQAVLYPVGDATIYGTESYTTTNYGGEPTLTLSYDGIGPRCAVLKFDLGGLPSGATIVDASLALRLVSWSGAIPVTTSAYVLTTDWSENTVTWRSPWVTPGGDRGGLIAHADVGLGGVYVWDGLEGLAQQWLASVYGNPGLILCGPTSGVYIRTFDSDESTGVRPALYVTYLDPATPPNPSGPGLAYPRWESVAPLQGTLLGAAGAWAANRFFVISGDISSGSTGVVRIYDPLTGLWSTGPNRKPTAVQDACAAVIGDDIYVSGGYRGEGTGTSVLEVLDAETLTWTTVTTDPLPAGATWGHLCGVLGGRLFIAGGTSDGTASLESAWVYDPAAPVGARWDKPSFMATPRRFAAGAVVGGRLYAVGGLPSGSNTDLATVEVYDPQFDSWSTLPDLTFPRGAPGAFGLGSRLVVCGGGYFTYRETCEAYDTRRGTTGAWTTYPGLVTGRRQFAYASSGDALYLAGGWRGGVLATAEAATGTQREPLPPMPSGLVGSTAAYAAGRLYLIDRVTAPDGLVRIYDPATGIWTPGPDKPTPVVYTCAGVIGGKIYVPGGSHDDDPSAVLEVLDTATMLWTTLTTDPVPVLLQDHACGVIDGSLYTAGGVRDTGSYATSFAFDPARPAGNRWYGIASPFTARRAPGGAVVNGRFYVAGGSSDGAVQSSVEVYDPTSDSWSMLARPMSAARYSPTVLAAGSRLIVCGGDVDTQYETCEAYDTRRGTAGEWVRFAPPRLVRGGVAYASDGRRLYAAGGCEGDDPLAWLETIDVGLFEVTANVLLPVVMRWAEQTMDHGPWGGRHPSERRL